MDDTIRTRVLNVAKTNWKAVAGLVVSLITGIVGTSIAWGGYVERMSNDKDTLERIEFKVDGVVADVSVMKTARAVDAATLKNLDDRQRRIEDNWDTAYEQAGTRPRPRKHK
ncbi:MAG: hypothetical protein JWO52_7827 [Gammaproteobacteria bacterium]|nr:hypothetical protein [Gammaproteobacteria bacterium]